MFATSKREAIKLAEGNEEMMKFIEKLENLKKKKTIMKDYYKDDDLFDAGVGLGREEGREQNQVETATTMLKKGFSIETVQECTKLSLDKINQIITLL